MNLGMKRFIKQLAVFLAISPNLNLAMTVPTGAVSGSLATQTIGLAQHKPQPDLVFESAGYQLVNGFTSNQSQELINSLSAIFTNAYSGYQKTDINGSAAVVSLFNSYVAAVNGAQSAVALLNAQSTADEIQNATNLLSGNSTSSAMGAAVVLMAAIFLNIDKGFVQLSGIGLIDPLTKQSLVAKTLPVSENADTYIVNFFVNVFTALRVLLEQINALPNNQNSQNSSTNTAAQQTAAQVLGLQPATAQNMQLVINQAGCNSQDTVESQIICATPYAIQNGLTNKTTPVPSKDGMSPAEIASLTTALTAFMALGGMGIYLYRTGRWPFAKSGQESLSEIVQRTSEEILGNQPTDIDLLGKLNAAQRAALDPSSTMKYLDEVLGSAVDASSDYKFLDDIQAGVKQIIAADQGTNDSGIEAAYQELVEGQESGGLGDKLSATDLLLQSAIPVGSDVTEFDILTLTYELPAELGLSNDLEGAVELVNKTLIELNKNGLLNQFDFSEPLTDSDLELFRATATQIHNPVNTGSGNVANDIGAKSGAAFEGLEGLDGLALQQQIMENALGVGRSAFEAQLQALKENLADIIEQEGADSANAQRLQDEYDQASQIDLDDIPVEPITG